MGTDKKIAIRSAMLGKTPVIKFPSGNGCMHIATVADYVIKRMIM